MVNDLEWVKRRVHFNDKTVLERFEAINVVKNSCINQSTNFTKRYAHFLFSIDNS